ncbi:MAG: hypothetical protein JWQ49_4877 [Edaphobacter sp.]|nr:hypothetical protein [Edaphobacter sp.]
MAIFYIPFNQDLVGEEFGRSGQKLRANTGKRPRWWKFNIGLVKSFEERNIRVLYRDSPQNLSGAGAGTHIYITGHGESGSSRISANDETGQPSLTPVDLALQLQERGLSKTFFGSIRIITCGSGFGSQSFAQQFSAAMGSLGYRFCGIYGYTEDIAIAEDLLHIRDQAIMASATKYSKLAGNAETGEITGTARQARRKFGQNKNPFNR